MLILLSVGAALTERTSLETDETIVPTIFCCAGEKLV